MVNEGIVKKLLRFFVLIFTAFDQTDLQNNFHGTIILQDQGKPGLSKNKINIWYFFEFLKNKRKSTNSSFVTKLNH